MLSPQVLALIEGPQCVWEQGPLKRLASQGELSAYAHSGFWQPMDTLRDKNHLNNLWEQGKAPWQTW